MSFNRPDLNTLIDRAITDIESRLPGADARLRRSNLNVLARVSAGSAHGLYGYLDWIARQILPDTAEDEMLDRFAAIYLPEARKPASYAGGGVIIKGSNDRAIPALTVFHRADGVTYINHEEARVQNGVAVVYAEAEFPGKAGNAAPGTVLTLGSPVEGIEATAKVDDKGMTRGADVEEDERLKPRIIARIQEPPHGGAAHDYVQWALEVPGVTYAWVVPLAMGDGTVTVRFVRDNDGPGVAIIPNEDEVMDVFNHIEARRPIGSHLFVAAPTPEFINFEIADLDPDTDAVRQAVYNELEDLIKRSRPEKIVQKTAAGVRIRLSHIRAAISAALGENDYVLVSPVADIVCESWEIPMMGDITWS